MEIELKLCRQCNKVFEEGNNPSPREQVFCSKECRYKANNERRKAIYESAKKPCPHCGKHREEAS